MFKLLNIKNLLLVALLILFLVSVIMLALTSYWLSNSTAFAWVAGAAAGDISKVYTAKGVEATEFWKDNKMMMLAPGVLNVIGALLVVTLVYVA